MRLTTITAALLAVASTLVTAVSPVTAAPADTYYLVHLSRVAQDAYRDQSSRLVVVTRGCLNLTLGEDVVYNDTASQLTFQDGSTCGVQGVYRPSIQLTRIDQDLYRDTAGQGYLHTRYCYEYAYSEDVVLLSNQVLFLGSGERCDVAPSGG